MTITDAKKQISYAMKAYFSKDEFGNYRMAPEDQRPVFLMGPPGIGKTAIMKQIADELGVGLVSYSMTHHTRQSALGLPTIKEKTYGGKTVAVSEYTMSEIIASVYELMEEGKVQEGILFLDEINCVSETLTPTMLQFLQYKIFGKHKVPDGWIVVAAGNPVEYNRSARDFDIVTWDRLKRIDVDVDYASWREYADNIQAHPAILTYLDAKKEHFYKIESTESGKTFVTARSWIDLSRMLKLCEPLQIPVNSLLISQYIQDKEIAEDFSIYYDLFNKYKSDYQIGEILAGHPSDTILLRAKEAPFDERLSLMGLLLDDMNRRLYSCIQEEDTVALMLTALRNAKDGSPIADEILSLETSLRQKEKRGTLSSEERTRFSQALAFLKEHQSRKSDFPQMKSAYEDRLSQMKEHIAEASSALENLFSFVENCYGSGNEMLILLSSLTSNLSSARFISQYGSEAYYRHNEDLMFYKRKLAVSSQL